jgi:hypothetical protein
MKQVWKEPLDHKGDATYTIDFNAEMTALGQTLADVVVTLSDTAITAGLSKAFERIEGNLFKLKFSIPLEADQIFEPKGTPLEMEVKYTSSGGEIDVVTAVILIKDK